jgi:antitoxin component of RelBE/YafQ-DinJ toxin-antitoxin module
MAKANLTIQLDAEVIRRARIVAAKRGMSVSAIVALDLTELADRDARYEEARARAEELLAQAIPRGGRTWRREDLHQR